ncbi:MAG: bacillithiol biosynthesis cysteine-adding enzyme BshC [Bacteroidota bacterium]
MQIHKYLPSELGMVNSLLKAYLNEDPALKSFTSSSSNGPHYQDRISTRGFSVDSRVLLTDALKRQYLRWNVLTKENEARLDLLMDPSTFTVTTGHQLNLFGGPAFFIYKVLSTIKLAEEQSVILGTKVLPVFWMASEDHDFEEIHTTHLFTKKVSWERSAGGAVGRMSLDGLSKCLNELSEILRLEVTSNLLSMLNNALETSNSYADFHAKLIHYVFRNEELIVIDADDAELKQQFSEVMRQELSDSPTLSNVQIATQELEALGYHGQVHPREINLFYLSEGKRERILKTSDGFSLVNSTKSWSGDEILEELENHPEQFSPNALLRPVYQECILPNLAYLGGPGELAYWFQLKSTFEHFNIPMPHLILRNQAFVIPKHIHKNWEQFNVTFTDFLKDSHVLTSEWAADQASISLEKERIQMNDLIESLAQKFQTLDPSLSPMINAVGKKWDKDLDGLNKKVMQATKRKNEVAVGKLVKAQNFLFPDRIPQERHQNFLALKNGSSEDLMAVLKKEFSSTGNQVLLLKE